MQAVLNTQELELNWFFLGRWILMDGFFKDTTGLGSFSDVGLGRFKDLDLDVGFFTGWTGNHLDIGRFIRTLDVGLLDFKKKRKLIDTGFYGFSGYWMMS